MQAQPSDGTGILAILWNPALMPRPMGRAQGLALVPPALAAPAREAGLDVMIGVPASQPGEVEMIIHNLPGLCSLMPAGQGLKALFAGLQEQDRQRLPCIPPAELIERLPAGQLELHLDTPGAELAMLELLEIMGLLPRLHRLRLRCLHESGFDSGQDMQAIHAWLETRLFRVITHFDQDPDWPVIVAMPDAALHRCRRLEERLAQCDETMSSRQLRHERLQEDHDALQRAFTTLQDGHDAIRREADRLRADLDRARQSEEMHRMQAMKTADELTARTAENIVLARQQAEAATEGARARDAHAALQERHDVLRHDSQKLQVELEVLRGAESRHHAETRALSAELDARRLAGDNMQVVHDRLTRELDTTSAELASARQECTGLHADGTALREEIARLKDEQARLLQRLETAQANARQQGAASAEWHARMLDLRERLARQNSEHEQMRIDMSLLLQAFDGSQSELLALRARHMQLHEDHDMLQGMLTRLTPRLHEAAAQLHALGQAGPARKEAP